MIRIKAWLGAYALALASRHIRHRGYDVTMRTDPRWSGVFVAEHPDDEGRPIRVRLANRIAGKYGARLTPDEAERFSEELHTAALRSYIS